MGVEAINRKCRTPEVEILYQYGDTVNRKHSQNLSQGEHRHTNRNFCFLVSHAQALFENLSGETGTQKGTFASLCVMLRH